MTIKRKIEKESVDLNKHKEMIMRGAQVVADKQKPKEAWTTICLRITNEMIEQIDIAKSIGTSRNAWILEAIQHKFKRD